MAKERRAAIAIATNENAAAARQWLELNGYRWQNGELKTACGPPAQNPQAGPPGRGGGAGVALAAVWSGTTTPRAAHHERRHQRIDATD